MHIAHDIYLLVSRKRPNSLAPFPALAKRHEVREGGARLKNLFLFPLLKGEVNVAAAIDY